MNGFTSIVVVGNVTRDPEVTHTISGLAICKTQLAVNSKVKRGDDYVDDTLFINIVIFGKRGSAFADYIRKGDPVLVQGKLKEESWEKEGQHFSRMVVNVDDFSFMKSKRQD